MESKSPKYNENISILNGREEINLKYDGSFDIATGRNRKETHWRNRETSWSAFLNKIKTTHRTAETHAEYMSSTKSRQDEIKDVGGFVGGYINGGRRKAENITHRQLITLDIDFAKGDVWEDFCLLHGCAAAIYSTHKHTPDNPRLRLIVPLDRPVGTDEYVAIARRIAGDLDINIFDDTTFEPSRLMYHPSTAKDAEFISCYQDGPWLSANEILATYKNWKDASEWPISDRVDKAISREIKKQGDPLEKPGIVGAFCRTYNIHEAIEKYLTDEYEPTADESRYTFKRGSTAAGLVVYDDKFTYSHHGTDPTSGKTCNAFDLVRLHLYGLQDEDVKENTPSNRLPSYTAMIELASNDPETKKRIGIERLQEMKDDFAESFEDENGDPINMDWLKEMDVDGKGKYKSTSKNIGLILDNDPDLKGKLALNKFENREIAKGDLPWRKVDPRDPYLGDKDDAGLRTYLETMYGITGVQKIQDGIILNLEANSFHPVREYLNQQTWDGGQRAETLFIDYLGAEDCEYIRAVTRKVLAAAVARVFRPGCKFDYVLTFVGGEGQGKSTFIKTLGRDWFSDSFGTVQGKEAYEQIQGVWLVEMAELAGLRKAEMETIKHFISKQDDRFRAAYAKRVNNNPRQCVFFATTNNIDFLRGETGNRRFWPVDTRHHAPTKDLFKDLNDYEVGQIWAEAVQLYKAGEKLYLDKALEDQARQRQIEHSEIDERAGLIQQFLDTPLPADWNTLDLGQRRMFWANQGGELTEVGDVVRQKVCVAEIWCELFGQKQGDMSAFNTKYIHAIMRNLEGWEEHKVSKTRFPIYGPQKGYVRQSSNFSGNKPRGKNGKNVTACTADYRRIVESGTLVKN